MQPLIGMSASLAQNPLEIALEKAFSEPGWRPEFFRLLMLADVWVPGKAADDDMQMKTAPHSAPGIAINNAINGAINAQSSVDLLHWEKQDASQLIPFFSSQQAFQRVNGDGQPVLVMPVRTLFAMTLGETLFLNPKLERGKEFTPLEVSRLLNGDSDPQHQQQILQGGVPLVLSVAEPPPEAIISTLTELFHHLKTVKRAFICQVKEQGDGKANLLLGIEAEGDIAAIIRAAGSAAADLLDEDEPIDICQVMDNDPGISHFMIAHITPFYQRRWGSFLRDFQNRII